MADQMKKKREEVAAAALAKARKRVRMGPDEVGPPQEFGRWLMTTKLTPEDRADIRAWSHKKYKELYGDRDPMTFKDAPMTEEERMRLRDWAVKEYDKRYGDRPKPWLEKKGKK